MVGPVSRHSMNDDGSLRKSIVLSTNRALLGSVTPNLRAVVAEWDDERILLVFYFHGEPSSDDAETMSVVHTEVLTDLIDIMPVDFAITRLDMPEKTHVSETDRIRAIIFERQEPHRLLPQ